MRFHLLVDDTRDWHNVWSAVSNVWAMEFVAGDAYVIARDYDQAVELLKSRKWDCIYLDHDLGLGKSGYDVICYIEANPEHKPSELYCVSSNPSGRKNILMAWESIQRYF